MSDEEQSWLDTMGELLGIGGGSDSASQDESPAPTSTEEPVFTAPPVSCRAPVRPLVRAPIPVAHRRQTTCKRAV